MSLTKCPECEKVISTEAKSCPHCGYPVSREFGKEPKRNQIISGQNIDSSHPEIDNKLEIKEKISWKKALTIFLSIFLLAVAVGLFFTFRITPKEKEAITDVYMKIDSIGEVNKNSGQKIENAERAFFNLDEKLKKNVKNSESLIIAKANYNKLYVNEVIQAIDEIGVVTLDSKPLIDFAYNSYELLSDEQKVLVNNIDRLYKASDSYNQLKANEVVDAITKIGVVTLESKPIIDKSKENYDLLTDEQKMLVTNFDTIQESYETFSECEITNVISKIDAIGAVTLNSNSAINTAQKAYKALTPLQRELVTNYSILEKSKQDYSKAQVDNVISLIDSFGTDPLENKSKVNEARRLYNLLNIYQKLDVENYSLLWSTESTIAKLEADEVNELIKNLNIDRLRASDETLVKNIKAKYNKLSVLAKDQVKDWDKVIRASFLLTQLVEEERIHSIIQIKGLYIFYPNSVGGTGASVVWYNKSKTKTINYIHFFVTPYNGVDDKVSCEIRKYSQVEFYQVGPFKYNEGNPSTWWRWDNLWYNSTIKKLSLDKVIIKYSDGTSVLLQGSDLFYVYW